MKFLKDNTIVDITEALVKDAKDIIEYFKIVGSESTYLIMDETGLNMTIEEEEVYLEKANSSKTNKIFIAKNKDEIIGEVGLKGHKSPKTKHNVSFGITVKKAYQNKGLGTLLIEHAINYARITGSIKNIYLEVREDNDYAIKLYKKNGFKQVGVMPDKIFIDGKYKDELIFLLQI